MSGNIEYTLKKSRRARRMRMTVYCDGALVVTAPVGLSQSAIESFVSRQSKWILDRLERFKPFRPRVSARDAKKAFATHKSQALEIAKERIEHFNRLYNFSFKNINIRNQKTRWGSCSRRGNLSFNYKIVLLEQHQRDYIIVHELCHLREFNHSPKFWALVAQTVPNYKEIRKGLKNPMLPLLAAPRP